ncbi:hypothetical protein QJS10_CPB12g00186 [Acorus calamus]|uniref:Uncharacterized protein n=1 Tax=Acorus calamus TaxID=4465 RepID=A0AAV9DM33_ACOCL|nr:hypothetical protein QJS10_CPB12g00186 [Acorus calamus]
MAPGHIIPMSSLAALFAAHGVRSTLLTTPSQLSLHPPSPSNPPPPLSQPEQPHQRQFGVIRQIVSGSRRAHEIKAPSKV